MTINVSTKDVRGEEYLCDDSVCVEIRFSKSEHEKVLEIVGMFNLERWFGSDFDKDNNAIFVLWQGE